MTSGGLAVWIIMWKQLVSKGQDCSTHSSQEQSRLCNIKRYKFPLCKMSPTVDPESSSMVSFS